MRTTRIYLPQALAPGDTVQLDARSAHHVSKVLRMKAGTRLRVFDGQGLEADATLETIHRKQVTACIQSVRQDNRESPLPIILGQGISKGERMDFVLQKSVELGVTEIAPLWTRYTQVQLDEKRLTKRMAHWEGVVISACEQSGRTRLPLLHRPQKLVDWLARDSAQDSQLMLDPGQTARLQDQPSPATGVRLLIGPEGGLSEEEQDSARRQGYTGVRLGPRVLRTETAALAAITAIQTLWGDLG